MGIEISRQTMSNWMTQSADRWLRPVYDRMKHHVFQKDIIHADETTLKVLKEPNRPTALTSYVWLYCTGREGSADYQTTRAGKHPKRFLEGFKEYLHTDGYDGYGSCARDCSSWMLGTCKGYFKDALKAMPKNMSDKPTVTEKGLAFLQ